MPDRFTPSRVHQIVRDHDALMNDKRDAMGLANAIYLTRYWAWYIAWFNAQNSQTKWVRDYTETEVNRLRKRIGIYIAALYPRANRATCSPDPMGRGDAHKAALALNAWRNRPGMRRQSRERILLGLLFPGCGMKVGYAPGRGSPVERVWRDVIPPWELVLDRNASSTKGERYRGHLYHEEIADVEARYPQLVGMLKGGPRRDFFEGGGSTPQGEGTGAAQPTDGEFVRVFEFCNLKDTVRGSGGDLYQGRLEVWVLDQGGDLSNRPVAMGPLPFSDADGIGLPHIEHLLFDNEPGYPLRPVAPVDCLIPQAIEVNEGRTKMKQDIRRNARKILMRKDALGQDARRKLLSSVDMEFVEVADPATPLNDILYVVPNPPLVSDTFTYMRIVDQDANTVDAAPPAARGQVTDATAREIDVVQAWSDADLQFHQAILAEAEALESRLVFRAMIACMRDPGDSTDGVLTPETKLGPVGAVHGEGEAAVGAEVAGATAAEVAGETAPAVSMEAAAASPGGVSPDGVARDGNKAVVEMRPFALRDGKGMVQVTAEDLDADFEIAFIDGARQPLTDQAMMQFLTGPTAETYFKLWDMVQKGGPNGVLAERMMASLAEVASLPKDLHVEELLEAAKALAEKGEEAPQPSPEAEAPAPPAEEPAEAPDPVTSHLTIAFRALAYLASLGPEVKQAILPAGQAVKAALEATKAGDTEAVGQAVGAAFDALDGVTVPQEGARALNDARQSLAVLLRGMAAGGSGAVEPPAERSAEQPGATPPG